MLKRNSESASAGASHTVVEGCSDSFETSQASLERAQTRISATPPNCRCRRSGWCRPQINSIMPARYWETFSEHGDAVWERFAGQREGTLWYYRALVREFKRKRPNRLVIDLERVVREASWRSRRQMKRRAQLEKGARHAASACRGIACGWEC